MPRYFLERLVGDVTIDELHAIAARSQDIRGEKYPQITWEHTHVVESPEGLRAFCLYESPDAESVKQHAAELGLPLERFHEVATDLHP
jgi:hypothetical protein